MLSDIFDVYACTAFLREHAHTTSGEAMYLYYYERRRPQTWLVTCVCVCVCGCVLVFACEKQALSKAQCVCVCGTWYHNNHETLYPGKHMGDQPQQGQLRALMTSDILPVYSEKQKRVEEEAKQPTTSPSCAAADKQATNTNGGTPSRPNPPPSCAAATTPASKGVVFKTQDLLASGAEGLKRRRDSSSAADKQAMNANGGTSSHPYPPPSCAPASKGVVFKTGDLLAAGAEGLKRRRDSTTAADKHATNTNGGT
jgi:hypothetical protein